MQRGSTNKIGGIDMENRKERIAKLWRELKQEIGGYLSEKFEWAPPNVWPGIFGIGQELTPEEMSTIKQVAFECPDCGAMVWMLIEEEESEFAPLYDEAVCPECGKHCVASLLKNRWFTACRKEDGSHEGISAQILVVLPMSREELNAASEDLIKHAGDGLLS
jgi:predicted RNA-binding Zn-ribbon protein involved in translation (DUF1610 family)